MYIRTGEEGTADDWFKLAEGESLDVDFSEFLTEADIGAANGVAGLDSGGKVPKEQLPSASAEQAGIVKLSSAVDSDDETTAAVPKAVKSAYDLADAARTAAADALTKAGLRDAAYCESEADMAGKNLRDGAVVFMKV